MFFKTKMEFDVTLAEHETISHLAKEIEKEYKVKVVEIYDYDMFNKYNIKIEGGFFRIIKMMKDVMDSQLLKNKKCVIDIW